MKDQTYYNSFFFAFDETHSNEYNCHVYYTYTNLLNCIVNDRKNQTEEGHGSPSPNMAGLFIPSSAIRSVASISKRKKAPAANKANPAYTKTGSAVFSALEMNGIILARGRRSCGLRLGRVLHLHNDDTRERD